MQDSQVYAVTSAQLVQFKAAIDKDHDCELHGTEASGTLSVKSPVGPVHLRYEYLAQTATGNATLLDAGGWLKVTVVSKPMFVPEAAVFKKVAGLIQQMRSTAPQESATQ